MFNIPIADFNNAAIKDMGISKLGVQNRIRIRFHADVAAVAAVTPDSSATIGDAYKGGQQ